ncbi:hypothetical protein P7K49_019089 [Saguinus oedipus]|uniref:Uncharacterized protein n=1 Tax=Saguinus oedipus TaxID=9490 RepID=A0ABQ9UY80_SAGOE|nr:hypothetical protein P7K49_019089 [Saguinus oedipus]
MWRAEGTEGTQLRLRLHHLHVHLTTPHEVLRTWTCPKCQASHTENPECPCPATSKQQDFVPVTSPWGTHHPPRPGPLECPAPLNGPCGSFSSLWRPRMDLAYDGEVSSSGQLDPKEDTGSNTETHRILPQPSCSQKTGTGVVAMKRAEPLDSHAGSESCHAGLLLDITLGQGGEKYGDAHTPPSSLHRHRTTHSSWEEEDELLKAREGPTQWPAWQGQCFSQGRDGRRPTWDPQGGQSTSMVFPDNRDVSMIMSEMDVQAIADTQELYFRELPEPLFTDEFYPTSMRASVSTGGLGVIGGISSMCTAAIRGCGK